jgi:hypothetical protein
VKKRAFLNSLCATALAISGLVLGAAPASAGLAALRLTGAASASTGPAAPLDLIQQACTIRAFDGHYLSAIGGGGRTTDVIETNRTVASTWETFSLDFTLDVLDRAAIRTSNGHYLTAVGGGGRTTDVIHSNATQIQAWEKFIVVPVSVGGGLPGGNPGWFAFQTVDGHYLTAVNSGGIGSAFEAIHSDATQIQAWEEFYIHCAGPLTTGAAALSR